MTGRRRFRRPQFLGSVKFCLIRDVRDGDRGVIRQGTVGRVVVSTGTRSWLAEFRSADPFMLNRSQFRYAEVSGLDLEWIYEKARPTR
jgi:hypothetical protein